MLTKTNQEFKAKLKSILRQAPSSTLKDIARKTGLTTGGVSWHMQALKKAKAVKRNGKGQLVVLK